MAVLRIAAGAGSAEGTNTTTHTFTLPSSGGIAAGDWLLVNAIAASSGTLTNATLGNEIGVTGGWVASGRGHHAWLYQLTTNDLATTFTLTSASSLKVATDWVVYRNLAGTPLAVTPSNTNTAATNGAPVFPAGSPSSGRVVLHLLGLFTAGGAPPVTYTPPSGMTLVNSLGSGGTTGRVAAAIAEDLTENNTPGTTWALADGSGAALTPSYSASTITLAAAPANTTPQGSAGGTFSFAGTASGQSTEPEDVLWTGAASAAFTTSSTKTLTGTVVPITDSRILLRGSDTWVYGDSPYQAYYAPNNRYPNTWDYTRAYGFTFRFTGQRFEVNYLYLGGLGMFRVSVNGQRITDQFAQSNGSNGGGYYYKVDLGQQVTNATILVECYGTPLAGLVPEAGATIIAANPFKRPPWLLTGDSQLAGSAYNTASTAGTFASRLARYRGWENPVNLAIGATGYVADGSDVNLLTRNADMTRPVAGMGTYYAGGNDGNSSIDANARSVVAQFKAAHPGVPLLIFGTFGPTFPASTARQNRDAEAEQVAIDTGCYFISPITGRVRNAQGTLVATRRPIIASAADQARYVNTTDNVHPNDVGHAWIARWFDQSMDLISPETGFGSSAGTFGWTGTAVGRKASNATAAGAFTWAGFATGKAVTGGSAVGGVAWAGTATGTRTPKGTASGSFSWSGTTTGKRTPKATASGSFSWAGTAQGARPVAGVKTGVASGSFSWAGSATGKRTPKAVAAGSVSWVGTSSGKRVPVATITGSFMWAGAATGARPSVSTRTGIASGAFTWTGVVAGKRTPKASASGTWKITGSASGSNGSTPTSWLYRKTVNGTWEPLTLKTVTAGGYGTANYGLASFGA